MGAHKAITYISYYLLQEPLPPVPLSGMLNKHGGKVRLTFKPEQDQLWLGTKERTEKLAMTSIKSKFNITKSTQAHYLSLVWLKDSLQLPVHSSTLVPISWICPITTFYNIFSKIYTLSINNPNVHITCLLQHL